MKFVFASERARLIRERNKYVADYNAKKAKYDEQIAQFKSARDNYSSDMEKFVASFLSAELEKLPGTSLKVMKEDTYRSDKYFISITYRSSKRREFDSTGKRLTYKYSDSAHKQEGGEYQGVSWNFAIYLETKEQVSNNGEHTQEVVVKKSPRIEISYLDSNDYEELQATYALFSKIDTIDWQTVLDHINSGVPTQDKYVSAPAPGYKDTSKWDESITNYNIKRIIGKDIWIKVYIRREESYDRYNSNNAGVDGDGWIKVDSATDKFYIFNWLANRYSSDDVFDKNKVDSALRHTYKLKKIYIEPAEPIEYMSTAELIKPNAPEINLNDENEL